MTDDVPLPPSTPKTPSTSREPGSTASSGPAGTDVMTDPYRAPSVDAQVVASAWSGLSGVMPSWPAGLVLFCGVLGGTIAMGHDPGLGLSLACLSLVAVTFVAVPAARPFDLPDRILLGIVVGLCAVPTLSDSPAMVALSLLGGAGILAAVAVRARTWPTLLTAPAMAGVSALFGLPWAGRRALRLQRVSSDAWSWVRAALLTLVLLVVVGGLLGSADAIFGDWLAAFVPTIRLDDELVARCVVGGLFAAVALAGAASLASDLTWDGVRHPGGPRPAREWLLPVVVTDLLLLAFIGLQAARLFPGLLEDVELPPGETLADQAHEGFGQLVGVTLVIVVLFAWASRRCDGDARQRRLLLMAGGPLVGLGLLVVVSAQARLLNYEAAYGWTVLRLLAGLAQLWLAVVLLLVAASWYRPVARDLTRLVLVSAGTFLLVTALVRPDALVAAADVQRFEETGKIDTQYLSTLSDDAVPALSKLPEPQRSCALYRWDPAVPQPDDGVWGFNVSRHRAAPLLAAYGGAAGGGVCPTLD